ncbi:hypothetical protein LZ009_08875 [Ramlibacter sp. XY19]|uniref:hypothetical protein n=1 Tax=Ramlibacter paludis TaxID=2908000 RepID=UPI0023DA354B|nr:hypothetical protein [Ramlibacter paludis]MCG2592892.1 hypothetical protein [Ramlibacter paludis]
METTAVQAIKLAIVAATGLSKDALHIYVGLAVFLVAAAASRRPVASWLPWIAVLAVALLGEAVDMRDDLLSIGHWRWAASLHDVLNTVFWPTVLMVLARATGVFTAKAR